MNQKKSINLLVSQMYEAYQAKHFDVLEKLIASIKEKDPSNHYAKRYEQLLLQATPSHQKIITQVSNTSLVSIQCPHCGASLSLQGTKKQLDGQSIECTHCHTSFVYKKTRLKTLFSDIQIGDIKKINTKEYRVVGGVSYKGSWYENNNSDSGRLRYIEWTLLDKSGDVFYLAESIADWQEGSSSGQEQEAELSWKIPFPVTIHNISGDYIMTAEGHFPIKEKTHTTIKSLQGENTKAYTIGESIDTYTFVYKGNTYIIEKEATKDQQEIGVYATQKIPIDTIKKNMPLHVSLGENNFLFGSFSVSSWMKGLVLFVGLLFVVIFLWFVGGSSLGPYLSLTVLFLLVLWISFLQPNVQPPIGMMSLVMCALGIVLFAAHDYQVGEPLVLEELADTSLTGNFRVDLSIYNDLPQRDELLARYDRGGREYTTYTYDGLTFSLHDEQDRQVLRQWLTENFIAYDKTLSSHYHQHSDTRLAPGSLSSMVDQLYVHLLDAPVARYIKKPLLFTP